MSEMFKAMLAEMAVRNKKIYRLRKAGKVSDAEIGRRFGISRQRVRVIYMTEAVRRHAK